jgi:nonsense-mediated mRNA decay protein 3
MMSMDLDQPVALPSIHQQTPTILCCNCGAPIDGTTAAGAMVCALE